MLYRRSWLGLALLLLVGSIQPAAVAGRMVVGVSTVNVAFLPIYLTQDKGFFKDEGIDHKIVDGGPGKNPIPIVAVGQAQFGLVTNGTAIRRCVENSSQRLRRSSGFMAVWLPVARYANRTRASFRFPR